MSVLKKPQREAFVTVQTKIVRLTEAEDVLATQLEKAGATEAAVHLRQLGLPTRRVEAYHYTDLKSLLRTIPAPVETGVGADAPDMRIPGSYRLMIANGVVQTAGAAPAGVEIGRVANTILPDVDDRMIEINRALAPEALHVKLSQSVDPVILIDHRQTGDAGHCNDAVVIELAAGGSAVVVETFSGSNGAHLGNHGSRVVVGAGAELTHILIDLNEDQVRHFSTVAYEIAADVKLRAMVIHSGAAVARTQTFARFSGGGAHGDFSGLNLIQEGEHADITLEIDHAVAHTTSTEHYKSVARGRGRAVVQGKIIVREHAQKTDAAMMVQGLMLCDEAEIFAKPELEIFADDVVCGHGATCGTLDEQSLFYLMSRGIPRVEAESMLVRAFIQGLFDPIEDAELHEALVAISDDWLVRTGPKVEL